MFPTGLALLMLGMAAGCSRSPSKQIEAGTKALREENPSRALRRFRSAAERLGEIPEAAPAWNAAGTAASRSGREEVAEDAFRRATDLNPDFAAAWTNLGILLRGQGRADESAAAFSRASEADPFHTEALEFLAADAVRSGEVAEAAALLRAAATRAENARILSSLAVAASDTLDVRERRDLLQRAVTLDPQFAPARLNLAALLDQHRLDPRQALDHYEDFIRLAPDAAHVPLARQRMNVMEARAASGYGARPDPAREEVRALLDRATEASRNGDSRLALRLCLQANAAAARAERTDLRERALRAAATLAPESARAQVGLGRFLTESGRGDEALRAFRAAHALAPTWPPAFTEAVELSVREGRVREARDFLQQTMEAAASDPVVWMRVAELYAETLGDEREARSIYRRVERDFPESSAASEARERLDG